MFSIEDGNECRIRTEKYFIDALKYVEIDENAKEIFEFNDKEDCIGCVWTRNRKSTCYTCGAKMVRNPFGNSKYEFFCLNCNTTIAFNK